MKKKIKNALISISDKTQIIPVLKILHKFKVNIISSGGTFKTIKKSGFKCKKYQNLQIFSNVGRKSKTLHQKYIQEYYLIDQKNMYFK